MQFDWLQLKLRMVLASAPIQPLVANPEQPLTLQDMPQFHQSTTVDKYINNLTVANGVIYAGATVYICLLDTVPGPTCYTSHHGTTSHVHKLHHYRLRSADEQPVWFQSQKSRTSITPTWGWTGGWKALYISSAEMCVIRMFIWPTVNAEHHLMITA